MTSVGSTHRWGDVLDSLVPDILGLVFDAWAELPAPAANAKENAISKALCLRLRQAKDRCAIPGWQR